MDKSDYFNISNYVNKNSYNLTKVTDVYQKLREDPCRDYYFLTEDNKPLKVAKIEKTHYSGEIYDVDVPNDVILVRRSGGTAVWSGNSNTKAVDISKYGNNGTFKGAGEPNWTLSGRFGSGLQFDGVDDYINLGSGANLNTPSAMTVEAWVRPASATTGQRGIVENTIQFGYYGWALAMTGSYYEFFAADTSGSLHTAYAYRIVVGEWTHIVGVKNSTNILIYVNGLLNDSQSMTTSIRLSTAGYKIGYYAYSEYSGEKYWNGTIDEVRIYNRSLTPQEIWLHYQTEFQKYNSTTYRFYSNLTNLTGGTYTYYGWANDSLNNWAYTSTYSASSPRYLFTAPVVRLAAPGNNTAWSAAGNVSFTFNVSDGSSVSYCNLSVDGAASQSMASVAKDVNQTFNVSLGEGAHNWSVNCTDAVGFNGFSGFFNVNVSVAPVLNFSAPTEENGTSIGRNWTLVNISITESNLDTFIFNWNGTNYTIYNGSLVLALNFNNNSGIGENYNNSNGTVIVDTSKYGRNGTLYVGADNSGNYTSGRFGGAYNFDGINDYVDLSAYVSSFDDYATGTVEGWFRLDPKATVILFSFCDKDTTQNLAGICMGSCTGSYADESFNFYMYSSNVGRIDAYVRKGETYYQDGKWHHFAVVVGSNYNKVYIDGEEQTLSYTKGGASTGNYFLNIASADSFTLGRRNLVGYDNLWVNGTLDEFRIYNSSLSAQEVWMHYQTEFQKYNSTEYRFYTNLTNLTSGTYTYYGWANDSVNNWAYTSTYSAGSPRYLTVGAGASPAFSVWLNSPSNQTVGSDNTPDFNYTVNGSESLYSCTLYVGSAPYGTNASTVNNTNSNITANASISDGAYYWYVNCTSGSTTNMSASRTITIDATAPVLNFSAPTAENGSIIAVNSSQVNISVSEATTNLSAFIFNWNTTNYSIYDSSLVLALNFNNNSALGENSTKFVDVSKYGNDGSCSGSSCPTFNSSGRFSGAMTFDSSSTQFVNISSTAGMAFSPNMTWSAWIYPNSGLSLAVIDQRIGSSEYSTFSIVISVDNKLYCLQSQSGSTWETMISTSSYQINAWNYVTCTNNGTRASMYLNGNLIGTDTSPATALASTSQQVLISKSRIASVDKYFNGSIDEVRIYNRSLSEREVWLHYQTEFAKYNSTEYRFYSNLTNLSDGTYTYYGWANDSANNGGYTNAYSASSPRYLNVDLSAPSTTASAVKNDSSSYTFGSWALTSYVNVTLTCSDDGGIGCDKTVYCTDTANTCTPTTTYSVPVQVSTEGVSYIRYQSNDTYGHLESVNSQTIRLDYSAPVLNFSAPTAENGTTIAVNSSQVNISVSEATTNLSVFKFNWNGTNYSIYDDSLVLALNFNNNSALGENASKAVDISRYGNNGTISGAVWDSSGRFGYSLNFNGSTDYVTLNSATYLKTRPLSVEAWVKTKTDGGVIDCENGNSYYGWYFRIGAGKLLFQWFSSTGGELGGVYSNTTVNDSTWHHVAVTDDGSNMRAYVDGLLSNTSTSPTPQWTATMYSYLGMIRPTSSPYAKYNGSIDEVRVYNRTLSAQEILLHYQTEFQKYNSTEYRFYSNLTNLSDGTYTYYGWANDSLNNWAYTSTYSASNPRYLFVNTALTQCGVISAPGLYFLTQDVSSGGTCMQVASSDVVVDCQGFTINYSQSSVGFGVNVSGGFDNVSVRNCVIVEGGDYSESFGVYFRNSSNPSVRNSSVWSGYGSTSSYCHGIVLENCSSGNVSNNSVSTRGDDYNFGVLLNSSSGNVLGFNTVDTSGADDYGYGVYLVNSSWNNMSNNTVYAGDGSDNFCSGVYFGSLSVGNSWSGGSVVTLGSLAYGVYLYEASNNSFSNASVSTSGFAADAFYILSSNYGVLRNNTVTTSGSYAYGAYFGESEHSNLSGNSFNTYNSPVLSLGSSIENEYFNHSVDVSNTEGGEPIYYLFNNNSAVLANLSNVGMVVVAGSNNVTVRNLVLDKDGIAFWSVTGSLIDNNTLTLSEGDAVGINVFYSIGNRLANNTIHCSGTSSYGMWLQYYSWYLNVSNNFVNMSGSYSTACYLDDLRYSVFSNDTFRASDTESRGIYFYQDSKLNTVANSSVQSLNDWAVYFYNYDNDQSDNLFYNCLLNGSSEPVGYTSQYSGEIWNASNRSGSRIYGAGSRIGGNYYTNSAGTGFSDTCTDDDHDGFCDSPYNVTSNGVCSGSSCGNNADFLPLSAGYWPPGFSVYLNSPANGSASASSTPDYGFNVSGNKGSYSCTLYVNDISRGSNSSVQNNTATVITSSTLSDGTYPWYVNCSYDDTVNMSATRTITIDVTPPALNFTAPTEENGTTITRNWTQVNISISESNLDTFRFDWNGTNYSIYDDSLVLALSFNNNSAIGECFDNVTEVLTDGGWKYFNELNGSEKVLTLNQNSLEPEWQVPSAWETFDHDREMYNITLEDGSSLLVSPEHSVYGVFLPDDLFLGNTLYPLRDRTNSLPLNCAGSTRSNRFSSASDTALMSGGLILMNTMPGYFSGGNCRVFAKCLSKVSNTLFSDSDSSATFSSSVPGCGVLTSNPLSFSDSTTFLGMFSSQSSFNSLWEGDIDLLLDQLGSVVQGGVNGFSGDLREVVLDHFVDRDSGFEEVQHLPYHDPRPLEGRLTMADPAVSDDVFVDFGSHNVNNVEHIYLNKYDLTKVTEVYQRLQENPPESYYFLTKDTKSLKVAKIEKTHYSGRIYDVDVPNDVILVRRNGGAAVWSGNSNTKAVDASKYGNNGTIYGGAAYTGGVFGSALGLDRAYEYVGVGSSGSLAFNGKITLAAWLDIEPTKVRNISSGGSHSCVVTENGSVVCWGSNEHQLTSLGDVTTTCTGIPALLYGDYNFSSISAGANHSCGVLVNGSAMCWGYNIYGQLGNGSATSSNVVSPVAVYGSYNFSRISLGHYHSCGVLVNGSVMCWGRNNQGQLGNGSATSTNATSPVAVSGNYNFSRISLGYAHSCGVLVNGSAVCWGSGTYGQLGNTSTPATCTSPTAVFGTYNFSGISLGYYHSCGILVNGSAMCWGYNAYGQIGNGNFSQMNYPAAVSGSYNFSGIALGNEHSCGVLVNGSAMCWGRNNYGQLGNGSITSSNATSPVAVSGNYNFSLISLGDYHSCGVLVNNSVMCWGNDDSSQCGYGTSYLSIKVKPAAVSGGRSFSSLDTGGYYSCGLLVNGSVVCWGYNDRGQIGNGNFSQMNYPAAVSGTYNFSKMDTGYDHSCGILVNGSAMCWGRNGNGQLGNGSATSNATVPVAVSENYNFSSISLGSVHSCGILVNGSAMCWGGNTYGQLGNGNFSQMNYPAAVFGAYNFSDISLGFYHSCGILVNGSMMCWGYNAFGQLGNGSASSSNATSPVAVSGNYNFSRIDLGSRSSCGVLVNGSAMCWGLNSYGQLGNGSASSTNATVPVAVSGNYNFSSVDIGFYHSCGVLVNGSVMCWGRNDNGELGNGSAYSNEVVLIGSSDIYSAVPVAVSGNYNFSRIYASWGASYQHSCGLLSNGYALCWGPDNYGQLGLAYSTQRPVPVQAARGMILGKSDTTYGIASTFGREIVAFMGDMAVAEVRYSPPAGWHHVATSYDRDSMLRLYVDGQEVGSSTPKLSVYDQSTDLLVGRCINCTTDEVRVYNRALSAQEIWLHYQTEFAKYNSTTYRFYSNVTNLSEGTYTYYGWANDTVGNSAYTNTYTASSPRYLFVAFTAPVVRLAGPGNNTVWSAAGNVSFTFNVSDSSSISFCNLSVDGVASQSMASVAKDVNQTFNVSLSEGAHNWSVNCTDIGGLNGFSGFFNVNVSVVPVLNFSAPTEENGTTIARNWTQANISVNEQNLDTFKFNWNGTNYSIYDDSLVLAFSFNNNSGIGEGYNNSNGTNIADISKYGNNGTLYVGAEGSGNYTSGRFGGAYGFDGVDDYVSVADSASLNLTGNLTVMAWAKRSAASSSPFASWAYKRQVKVSNVAGNLSNYQVNVSLNATPLYEAGKLNSTCKDIRFTYYNSSTGAETSLDYWTENCTTNNNVTLSVFWVNVTYLQNDTNTTLYIYYGNQSADSASDGSKTFAFFDDFSGSSLNSSKWTSGTEGYAGSSITVSNGYVRLYCPNSGDIQWAYISSQSQYSFPLAIEARARVSSASCCHGVIATGSAQLTEYYTPNMMSYESISINPTYTGSFVVNGNGVSTTTVSADTWTRFALKLASGASSSRIGQNVYSNTQTFSDSTNYLKINNRKWYYSDAQYDYDWVAIRGYASVDPSLTIGSEENRVNALISKGGAYYLSGGSTMSGGINSQEAYASVSGSEQWHHYAMTYNSSSLVLYLDGSYAGSAGVSGPIGASSSNVSVGYQSNGTIDEVRVYNRSLSAQEVWLHYQMEFQKYNSTEYRFYSNVTNLSGGTYTYYGWANDSLGNSNYTVAYTASGPRYLNVNIGPSVSSVVVNDSDGGSIQLSVNDDSVIYCNATVSDQDGWQDVFSLGSVNATLHHEGSSAGASDDKNVHYTNASCSYANPSGTSATAVCAFTLEHESLNGTWTCTVTAKDSLGSTASATGTNTVDQLVAVDISESWIHFGVMELGSSSSVANSTNVTNKGNVLIDLQVAGNADMSCASGSLGVGNISFNLSSGAYATMSANKLSTSLSAALDFNLAPEGTASFGEDEPATNLTYWTINVPSYGMRGECNNTITIAGVISAG